MIILPILITSLIHLSLKGWEYVLFELGSEKVITVDVDTRLFNMLRFLATISMETSQSMWRQLSVTSRRPWRHLSIFSDRFVCVGQNPDQDASDNIPMAAATYAVGGMATHWNGNIPREHPTVERSDLLTDTEWDELYEESESLLGKSESDLFPISIRHTVVAEALKKAYPKLSPQRLAYAARKSDGSQFVTWSGADTVLGDRLVKMIEDGDERMTLKVGHFSFSSSRRVISDGNVAAVRSFFSVKLPHV